ncbi:hypothetical protein AX17_007550 [Amanita inopinata Kibby_2008]|nr:hypothetical protein AX17_007550 [Amanita inopinata Kibby_2008]
MTHDLHGPSVKLFSDLVEGKFSEFAETFGTFLLTMVPQRILSSVEMVYQDYLYAYLSSAARAMIVEPQWTTRMEIGAGNGRADIIFYQKQRGVIIKLKRLPHKQKEGYRAAIEGQHLSHETTAALRQCETRHYRAFMPEDVKTVHEYGLAFMGLYCGIEARTVERDGPGWVMKTTKYTAEQDEEQRQKTYCC